MSITPAEVTKARELLGWTRSQLAVEARVSPASVGRFERGGPKGEWIEAPIRAALEAAGVAFTNGGEPGVKLRKPE
jgi:transcriptional regulator with XRE-family HTH domain